MRLVGRETKEAGVASSYPKLFLMINQKVMQEIVRQAFTLGVTRRAIVGPVAIKPGRRGQPE